jgi:glycosyltransferase involved in cell wall biosynthesis
LTALGSICKIELREADITREERSGSALRSRYTNLGGEKAGAFRPGAERLVFGLARALPPTLRQLLKPTLRRLWYGRGCRRLVDLATDPAAPHGDGRYRVVFFPVIDWELRTQRPQQMLARIAAQGCSVLYLRNDFARGPRTEITKLLPPHVTGVRLPGPAHLNIYGAPPTPAMVDSWVAALEPLVMRDADLPTVALVQWPFWTALALAARSRWGWPVIYDCIDDHGAFTKTRRDTVDLERFLVSSATVVITTSRVLQAKYSAQARRHVYLPNGADCKHFVPREPRPHATKPTTPVVGYVGALADWFDAQLVRAAAEAHPKCHFELIGMSSGADLRPLAHLGNVTLAGEMPYDDVAAALQRFDVAIIPFKINQLTKASNPVKVYEYLAAGRPVVSVRLPELERFAGLVYLASDPDAFVRLIGVAIAENDPVREQARIELARANDWSFRVAVLDEEIRRALASTPAPRDVTPGLSMGQADRFDSASPMPSALTRGVPHLAPTAGLSSERGRVARAVADRDMTPGERSGR